MAASITFNGKDLIHKIDILQSREIPWITALTISGKNQKDISLVSEAKKDLFLEMDKSFIQVGNFTKIIIDKPRATKKSLNTTIFHIEEYTNQKNVGQAPADYLLPQITGGLVLETRFQKRLKNKGFLKSNAYMFPLHDQTGLAKRNGRLSPTVYNQALWGMSAMEEFRNTNLAGKYPKKDFKTKGTFVHVPRDVAKVAASGMGGMDLKRYAQNIRALNHKKGEKWGKIPSAGIYKVMAKGKGLKQVFRELDSVPTVDKNYDFQRAAAISVNKNIQKIFDLKVKEVLGS